MRAQLALSALGEAVLNEWVTPRETPSRRPAAALIGAARTAQGYEFLIALPGFGDIASRSNWGLLSEAKRASM